MGTAIGSGGSGASTAAPDAVDARVAAVVEPRLGAWRRCVDAARLVHRAGRYRWRLNPRELSAMARLLPRGGVGIDVGAHKGAYAYRMAGCVGPGGRVVAIEPQARLAGRTAGALRSLGLSWVRVLERAASDRCGIVEMDYREGSTHGAALDGLAGAGVVRTRVEAVTIDAVAAGLRLGRVDFIKIDVEGHEQAVLRGAMGVLAAHRPSLLVEIEARHHAPGPGGVDPLAEARAMLEPLGYRTLGFAGRRCVEVAGSGDGLSNNFLFVEAGRAGLVL